MAYNGSGTFNRLYNWEDDRDADVLIRADRMDAEMDGMATGLSTAICKDGQTTITANLPMAGFRHTGVGNASARTHYAAYGQVQDNAATWGGTAGGTANALTVTMTPTVTALTTGQIIWLKASATNTGAATLAVDAVAAKNIYGHAGAAITSGDIINGNIYGFAYDGTQFILLNPTPKGAWVQIGTASASNNATIDLAIPAGFDEYEIALYDVVPATDAVDLRLRTSTDGGSTFDSGVTDYHNGSEISVTFGGTVGSDTNENGVSGWLRIFRPSVAQYCHITIDVVRVSDAGGIARDGGGDARKAAADVDYVRFYFSSGNVESGEFRVLARRK